MNHIKLNFDLSNKFVGTKFSATIGDTGGFITFSNSGQRGKKYFTLSLAAILTIFQNIRDNFVKFDGHSDYVEKKWRDLGAKYYSDETANTLSTVQTKPLFATISKIINIANNIDYLSDDIMELSLSNVNSAIVMLEKIIDEYTPTIVEQQKILNTIPFQIDAFKTCLQKAKIILDDFVPYKFVSSLQAKPFVILTGLSGSGKTKLAEAFSLWVTGGGSLPLVFKKGFEIKASKTTYKIINSDSLGVVVEGKADAWMFLPYELIRSWVKTIRHEGYSDNTPSQTIQQKVLERGIRFSPTMNSFHSPLKAIALKVIEMDSLEEKKYSQHCMVAVGADWTNREPLLGFPNALEEGKYVKPDNGVLDLIINAENDLANPYFLILDEMNMSHVERYFADFLSAMESTSKKIALHSDSKITDVPHEVTLPPNLFIIGTVNIDETTYMFSPKVLDRANVIEFRVSESEMNDYFKTPSSVNMDSLIGAGASMGESFVAGAIEKNLFEQDLGIVLMPFFKQLKNAGTEFGYRTASEMSRFIAICEKMADSNMTKNEVIDAAIMQKLLPKLHGSRNKLESILIELGKLCLNKKDDGNDKNKSPFDDKVMPDVKYLLSYQKLKQMHDRVLKDGFTSFAEA
jgi:hypothetical protein